MVGTKRGNSGRPFDHDDDCIGNRRLMQILWPHFTLAELNVELKSDVAQQMDGLLVWVTTFWVLTEENKYE